MQCAWILIIQICTAHCYFFSLRLVIMNFFQVEVTKFDALEEAHAELKLKQQLWDSIDEWDKLSTDWLSVRSFAFFLVRRFIFHLFLC